MVRAKGNLDAAEVQLLTIARADYMLGQRPSLLRHLQRHLKPTDPGRQAIERVTKTLVILGPERRATVSGNGRDPLAEQRVRDAAMIERQRGKIPTTARAASSEALRVNVRLRSFRNVVVFTTVIMALLVMAVAIISILKPTGYRGALHLRTPADQ